MVLLVFFALAEIQSFYSDTNQLFISDFDGTVKIIQVEKWWWPKVTEWIIEFEEENGSRKVTKETLIKKGLFSWGCDLFIGCLYASPYSKHDEPLLVIDNGRYIAIGWDDFGELEHFTPKNRRKHDIEVGDILGARCFLKEDTDKFRKQLEKLDPPLIFPADRDGYGSITIGISIEVIKEN